MLIRDDLAVVVLIRWGNMYKDKVVEVNKGSGGRINDVV